MEAVPNISREIYENFSMLYTPSHVWTYNDLLGTLSSQFVDQILRISLVFLGLELVCLWYVRSWDLPSWFEIKVPMNERILRNKILKTAVYIACIPAFYLPIIIILYKYGITF